MIASCLVSIDSTVRTRFVAMFIHEMTIDECHNALRKATVGRLGCALNNQPYVVPINFAFDGTYLYGFTTFGQKVEWLRANPLVSFEVDEITDQNNWMSIILFGRYEELPDRAEYEKPRIKAHSLLQQQRPMWWEPAYVSQEHRDQPHSLTPIFYRIHIGRMTGHRAIPEKSKPNVPTPSKRGWLEKLLDPLVSLIPSLFVRFSTLRFAVRRASIWQPRNATWKA